MIDPQKLLNACLNEDISFYTGVPDSLLKDFCACIENELDSHSHIISTNEGSSLSLGIGYHLATNKIPLIYLQNSGIGNLINPLLSLADPEVYNIPLIIMVGWRGEPGVKDEPQHIKQGKITDSLIKTMGYEYEILENDQNEAENQIRELAKNISSPHFLLVKKGTFANYDYTNKSVFLNGFKREEAIRGVVDLISEDDVIFATTGMISRELYEYRVKKLKNEKPNFLTVGGMGHCSQIALGYSHYKSGNRVFCFDGDGSVLMHMGGLGIIGQSKVTNFNHIIFNNSAHDSVGGQPTIGGEINFEKIAIGLGYDGYQLIESQNQLTKELSDSFFSQGKTLMEIRVEQGNRSDLGRPIETPIENKINLMNLDVITQH